MSYSLQQLKDYISDQEFKVKERINQEAEKVSLRTIITTINNEENILTDLASKYGDKLEPGDTIELKIYPFKYMLKPKSLELWHDSRILKKFETKATAKFYDKVSKELSDKIIEYLESLPF